MDSTTLTDMSQLPQVAGLSLNESSVSGSIGGEDKAGRAYIRHHTKSRTGCLTCKTRRIKCDEAKPGCERCEKGGFTCDGYVVPESRKSKSTSQRPHTKSRSGCSHCKTRRVKCDEAKPKCGWCAKTSQDCQYEEIAAKAPNEKKSESRVELQPRYPSVSQLSLNLVLGNEGEKLSFHFYVEKMGPMLAGTCDREFWTRIIIQRTVLDPAIWHCIMALSMLQQQSISRSSDSAGKVLRAQALQHYNKSVACLTRKSTVSQVPTEIMVMSCAVFACIEAVLGDIEGSRRHIASGIGIINDWRKQNPSVPAYQRILVEGHIEPIFQNMMSQSSFYVTRNYFEKLKQATYQFEKEYRDLDPEKWSPALTFAVERKNDLLVKSHHWLRSFESFLKRPAAVDLRVDEVDAIPFMRHQHGVLHLRIETLLRTDELVYDQYHAEFEKTMDQADETLVGVLFRGPKFTTSLLPSLNAEETSLFTIATKCRNPRIRRRALDFMKKTRDQLLFRDDDLSIKVVERAIAAEEEGLQGLMDATGAEVPSDWARIYEIVIDSRGSDGIVGSHRAAVSFKRKSRTDISQWVWTCGFVEYDVTECVSSIAQKRC